GAFARCNALLPFGPFADGAHVFSVRAVNGAGLIDPTPATRSFTVDSVPPDTAIDFGPEGTVANRRPSFGYSSEDPSARFECRVDSGPFEFCGYETDRIETALPDGSHTFSVRANDAAGNPDPSPATRTFVVDATAPEVKILTGPSGPTVNANPS